MDILDSIEKRIAERAAETKTPCRTYATRESANTAAKRVAEVAGKHFAKRQDDYRPARYLLLQPACLDGRWVCVFDMSELMQRASSTGGYIGICGDHFTF